MKWNWNWIMTIILDVDRSTKRYIRIYYSIWNTWRSLQYAIGWTIRVHGLDTGGLPMQFNPQFHGCTVHCAPLCDLRCESKRCVGVASTRGRRTYARTSCTHRRVSGASWAQSPPPLQRQQPAPHPHPPSFSWRWRGSRCVRCWLKRTQSTTAPA